jgi:hypothetical protein
MALAAQRAGRGSSALELEDSTRRSEGMKLTAQEVQQWRAYDDAANRERRLRRLAAKRGFTLTRPWASDRRNIGGDGFVLVPHNTGMTLDEVEAILSRTGKNRH